MCIGYKLKGKTIDYLPSSLEDQVKVKPIYKKFNGWLKNTSGIKKWKELSSLGVVWTFTRSSVIQSS